MTPAKELERKLLHEYARARATLLDGFSFPSDKGFAEDYIQQTLLTCSAKQAEIMLADLPESFLSGVYLESDILRDKVPAYTGVDLKRVSKTHLKRISTNTIGGIGNFNTALSSNLTEQYNTLLMDNELVNSISAHGWTKNAEKRMIKAGFDKEIINLVKQQTTANKMVQILEQQGIKGGMHPNDCAELLQPHIRDVFGDGGVEISNIGKLRKELIVNAKGKYWWREVKVTHPYHSTVQNYADIITRSSMLKAHNEGRLQTLRQSGLVEKYRFICDQTANSCSTCLGMHGLIVEPSEVTPPIHPRCSCRLAPVWKKSTGLHNHSEKFYTQQRDTALFKRYKLKEYNKTHETKLINENFLPPIGEVPKGSEMAAIREAILG